MVRRRLPALPPEIWHDIIYEATFVPGALDTGYTSVFDRARWEEIEGKSAYNASLKTKLAIVSVCRGWKRDGLRRLYEDIRIDAGDRGQRMMTSLTSALARSCNPADRRQELGWWIKRLDLSSVILSDIATFPIPFHLLSCCHNLHTFKVIDEFEDVALEVIPILSDLLTSRFNHSLRHLDFPLIISSRITPSAVCALFLRPLLETVAFGWGQGVGSTVREFTFPNASSLEVTLDGYPPPWHFPSLHTLTVLNYWESEDTMHLEPFIKVHGHLIHSLAFYASTCEEDPRATGVRMILSHTPNLKELLYHAYAMETELVLSMAPGSNETLHLGVTRVGLFDHSHVDQTVAGHTLIITLRRAFPNLACLRFFPPDPDFAGSSSTSYVTASLLQQCNGWGIRIEDVQGNIVTEPLHAGEEGENGELRGEGV